MSRQRGERGEEPGIQWNARSRARRRALALAELLGGEVAPRRARLHNALWRFPGDVGKYAPPRILVARGCPVAPEADSAIARALAVREQLDRCPQRQPVIAKEGRGRDILTPDSCLLSPDF
jgi:hypothetical protein